MASSLEIPGYEILEVIHQGLGTIIYRGVSQAQQQPVILKTLTREYPTSEQINRLKHEYQIAKNLDLKGVVPVYGLENYQDRLFLVAEDFGGISLKQFLVGNKRSLTGFLSIAVQIAQALVSLHTNHIAHNGINPSNIIINPKTKQVKITDFSIASRLTQETPERKKEISSKQTNTPNYLRDFYSLGVTFYEMLTGELPLTSNEPLELLCYQIDKKSNSLHKLNPEIPSYIASIITKLMAVNAEKHYKSAADVLSDLEQLFYFYSSLTHLADFNNISSQSQAEILKRVQASQLQLEKCGYDAPNYLHKLYLVEAELCRVLGKVREAMDYYEKAIAEARKNSYIQETALANELTAKFYLSLDKVKIAQLYLNDAYLGYQESGAKIKVQQLEEMYSDWLVNVNQQATTVTNTSNDSKILDLTSVAKALQAISSEIFLDKLLQNVLHVILQSTAAQQGCIILERNHKLFIEITNTSTNVLQSIPVETSQDIPITLINYVSRNQQTLILNNVKDDAKFKSDPYIIRTQPKSLLCTPILLQNKLIGIIYLENNLITGGFTYSRLEIVKLLTLQAASAIQNARLYAKEQKKVRELAQKQKNLKAYQAELLALFSALQDVIIVLDIQGRYLKIAPNSGQLLYRPSAEILGKTVHEVLPLELADFFLNYIHQTLQTRQIMKMEYTLPINDSDVWFEASMVPLEVDTVVFVARDISDRKIAENQIKQKSADLEKALIKLQNTQSQLIHTEKISALGQLVAGIAHEVNNPVSFISGNLPYIKKYFEDLSDLVKLYQEEFPNPSNEILKKIKHIDLEYLIEDLAKILDSINLGTERINDIMLSLRNYSRVDGNEKKAVNIHEGIDSTLIILSHRLKAKLNRQEIEVIKQYGELPLVECFPGQLNQVFTNLIANAIDAIDELSADGDDIKQRHNQILIETSVDNDWVTIKISDNGAGIKEEVKPQIFYPFFTTKPSGKGTGIGLSISYEIITQKHGGTLECISSPGSGATFVIRLRI